MTRSFDKTAPEAETRRHAVVLGAGVAGLASALALCRIDYRVTVVEQDGRFQAADCDAAFANWKRKGVPHFRHSHIFHPSVRQVFRQHYPDLYERLRAVGAQERGFRDALPENLKRHYRSEEREDPLTVLYCRRTTLERELLRRALDDPRISITYDTKVTGMETERSSGGRIVTGLSYAPGEERAGVHRGDLFVDASGSRTQVSKWLKAGGFPVPEPEVLGTQIVYFTRWYRLKRQADLAPFTRAASIEGRPIVYRLFPGDKLSFSVTITCGSQDKAVIKHFTDTGKFHAFCLSHDDLRYCVNPETSDEASDVFVMAGLENVWRNYDAAGWAEMPENLFCVGDSLACTNPAYGGGCGMAFRHAEILIATLSDATAAGNPARQYHARIAVQLKAFYLRMKAQDIERLSRRSAQDHERELTVVRGLKQALRAILDSNFLGRRLQIERCRLSLARSLMVR